MTTRMARRYRSAGFTLVELSIVLVIISLLTAGGLVVGTAMLGRAAYVDTTKQMEQINQSLRDYYVINGHLPCVASLSDLPGSANFGVDIGTGGTTCAGGVAANSPGHERIDVGGGVMVRVGMLPVRTLGLPDSAASDEYGNRIIYAVTEALTDAGQFGTEPGAITVQDMGDNPILTSAAYFIVSPGRDRKGALAYSNGNEVEACDSVAAPPNEALDEVNCTLTTAIFRDAPYNSGSQEEFFFDDIVRWAPKFHLQAESTQSSTVWAAEAGKIYSIGIDNTPDTTDVGIGTPNPEEKLHVEGTVQIGAADSEFMKFTNAAAPDDYEKWSIADRNNAGNLAIRSHNADWSEKETFLSMEHDTGHMGIGIENPEDKLHIDGAVRIHADNSFFLRLYNEAANDDYRRWAIVDNFDQGKLSFRSRYTDWSLKKTFLSLDHATGYVGIGTVSPAEELHLDGTFRIDSNGSFFMYLNNSAAPADYQKWALLDQNNTGVLTFKSRNTDWTEKDIFMSMDHTTGYVGIGNTAPATDLHITGNARVDTNNDFYIYFQNLSAPAGSRNWALQDVSSAGKLVFRSRNDDWSFKRTYIAMDESTGNLGLFTSTPTEKVHVNGNMKIGDRLTFDGDYTYGGTTPGSAIHGTTASNEHLTLFAQDSSSNGASISLAGRTSAFWGNGRITYRASYNSSDGSPMHHFYRITSGGGVNALAELQANGNMYIYGTSYNSASDRRLKKDIRPIESALDKVMALNGIYYRWNEKSGREDTDSVHLGVIAQEVQAIFPEAVQTNQDGFLALDRSSLVPVLIEAVKELKKENDSLRAEIKSHKPDKAVITYDPLADYRLWIMAALIAISASVTTTLLLRRTR